MMIRTLNLSTRLALGDVLTYMLGLMLDAHNESSKPKIEGMTRQNASNSVTRLRP